MSNNTELIAKQIRKLKRKRDNAAVNCTKIDGMAGLKEVRAAL